MFSVMSVCPKEVPCDRSHGLPAPRLATLPLPHGEYSRRKCGTGFCTSRGPLHTFVEPHYVGELATLPSLCQKWVSNFLTKLSWVLGTIMILSDNDNLLLLVMADCIWQQWGTGITFISKGVLEEAESMSTYLSQVSIFTNISIWEVYRGYDYTSFTSDNDNNNKIYYRTGQIISRK